VGKRPWATGRCDWWNWRGRTVRPCPGAPGLTNRLDLAPALLALIYRHRWQVELFFRWLKCLVNFRHFFAESESGVAWQVLVALIGTLLLALVTGARPNSYDWAMMTHVASRLLPANAEFYRILARRRAERQRAAEWQKAYRARKKTSV